MQWYLEGGFETRCAVYCMFDLDNIIRHDLLGASYCIEILTEGKECQEQTDIAS